MMSTAKSGYRMSVAVGMASALLALGCGARMASVSDQRSAYVVRETFLGTDLYYCEAKEGADPAPTCKKVEEVK